MKVKSILIAHCKIYISSEVKTSCPDHLKIRQTDVPLGVPAQVHIALIARLTLICSAYGPVHIGNVTHMNAVCGRTTVHISDWDGAYLIKSNTRVAY